MYLENAEMMVGAEMVVGDSICGALFMFRPFSYFRTGHLLFRRHTLFELNLLFYSLYISL